MDNSERILQMEFPNGDVHKGSFKGLLPHGKGKYVWSNGTIYEGDWSEGKMTGKGKLCWPSGATYEGDFSGDYLHGFGTFAGIDGSVYMGSWRMNIQHGLGRKQYQNLDTYDGSWKEGVYEGSGRYAWSNGSIYIGNWKAGKMCGRGVMTWPNGDLYDGSWLNGLRHGSGCYRFEDGSYYFGVWTKGLKDGWGMFYPTSNKSLSLLKCSSVAHEDKVKEGSFHSLSSSSEYSVKPSVMRSLSENISINGFLRNSSRVLQRVISLDKNSSQNEYAREDSSRDSFLVLSHTVDGGQHEMQENKAVVYEREYIQGFLIKERIRSVGGLTCMNKKWCKFHGEEVKKGSRMDIFQGRRSFYLMLNLQLGIRYTVGKITSVPLREVRPSDFGNEARIKMYFPRKGSPLMPPHNSMNFYWKDYYPMVFRNLREMFKLDAAEYMMSISGDDGLREFSSSGKSGSIFYLSSDDRFVIKTLRRNELKVLLKMLPSYYNHVKGHENTLITKFFGVHRITLKPGKKVRFVVMGNMFCTELRVHNRYDLKGSSHGRFTNKDKIDESTTLKDLDLSYVFHMDRSLHESLLKQLSLDCFFLESQKIIDYSLLLGIHFRAPEHMKAFLGPPDSVHRQESSPSSDGVIPTGEPLIPPKSLLLVTHDPNSASTLPGPHIRGHTLRAFSMGDKEVDVILPGTGRLRVQVGVNMPAQAVYKLIHDGIDSIDAELYEIYDVVIYLGIIDVLQEYNTRKKVERAYKSLHLDPLSISVVEPKLYSKRFIGFLEKVFLYYPS